MTVGNTLQVHLVKALGMKDGLPRRASIPILNQVGGSLTTLQLDTLLDLLGVDSSTPLAAGWWQGWNEINDYRTVLGSPSAQISLAPQTDLEWEVWKTYRHTMIAATAHFGQSPGVITLYEDPTWVIVTTPADFLSRIYPDWASPH